VLLSSAPILVFYRCSGDGLLKVKSLVVHADKYVITGSTDGGVRMWSVEGREQTLQFLVMNHQVRFSSYLVYMHGNFCPVYHFGSDQLLLSCLQFLCFKLYKRNTF